MSIYNTYAEIITEDIIRQLLEDGTAPSVGEIADQLDTFLEDNDISQPLFNNNSYNVAWNENASALKWNNCNEAINKDIRVLYKHLISTTDQSIQDFDRWRIGARLLEGRLDDLQERLTSLLLIAQDTAGYFNFMQDNFVNTSKVDLSATTAYVNIDKGIVTLGTSSTGATRIDTSDIPAEDIEFTVLSRNERITEVPAKQSNIENVLSDVTNFWQTTVFARRPQAVTAELKINLPSAQSLSRIDIDLHQSNQNSSMQITPMLSTDNYNFSQLATNTFTRSVMDKTTFYFTPTSAQYVKLILTKTGYDTFEDSQYGYEFGFDEIALYNEGFAANTDSQVVSEALSVTGNDGQPEEFSKLVLEVCEDVPEDTTIDYSVAVFNSATTAVSDLTFVPIDPLDRSQTSKPTVLDFGDISSVTVSGIQLSYNTTATSGVFSNPAQDYIYVPSVQGTTIATSSGTASAVRYTFSASNERILDHTLSSGINIAQGTLEVWRNVNRKGYDDTKVRGYQNGWGFEDPYYKTTIYAENKSGVDIDFGSNPVIIDGAAVTGKVNIAAGRHTVMVHKDNWRAINRSAVVGNGLSGLKDNDPLYPYNHRYLIEGFAYPGNWPTAEEKVYQGFDIVAEFFMSEVSPFDMANNVASDNYSVYAIDQDAEDATATLVGVVTQTGKEPSRVFVMKVNENNSDFINEEFLIKFKAANSLSKYVRLKAVLSTEDTAVAPSLDSYRIKISS